MAARMSTIAWGSVAVGLGLASFATSAAAQRSPRWQLSADNDFFNFWTPQDERPDRDYTQGLVLTILRPGGSLLSRTVFPNTPVCDGGQPAGLPCVAAKVNLKQEIFTPERNTPRLLPGNRPYLGWLSFGVAAAREAGASYTEVGVELGVTGPPSLAAPAQKAAHRVLGFAPPLGWDGQLAFEPGVVAWSEWRHAIATVNVSRRRLTELVVFSRARLGNIVTDARAGVCLEVGWNVSSCLHDMRRRRGAFGVSVLGSVAGSVVLHNIGLDGSTFRPSPSVEKRHVVPEAAAGLSVRVGGVQVAWLAIARGREYVTQSKPHSYSRIQVSF